MSSSNTEINKLIQHQILSLLCCKLKSLQTLEEYTQSHWYKTDHVYKRKEKFYCIDNFLTVPHIADFALVCKDWFRFLSMLNYRYFCDPSPKRSYSSIISKLSGEYSLYQLNDIIHIYIGNLYNCKSYQETLDFINQFKNLKRVTINVSSINQFILFNNVLLERQNNIKNRLISDNNSNNNSLNDIVFEFYIKNKEEEEDDMVDIDVIPARSIEFIHVEVCEEIDNNYTFSNFLKKFKVNSLFIHDVINLTASKFYLYCTPSLKYIEISINNPIEHLKDLILLATPSDSNKIQSFRASLCQSRFTKSKCICKSIAFMDDDDDDGDSYITDRLEDWQTFCKALSNNSTLKELYLSNKCFRHPTNKSDIIDKVSSSLSNALCLNHSLERLTLSCHLLSQSFYECMSTNVNRTIRYLKLREIGIDHLKSIGNMLRSNNTLKELSVICLLDNRLDYTYYRIKNEQRSESEIGPIKKIKDETARIFVDGVKSNQTLIHLYMYDDPYSDEIVSLIENEIDKSILDDIYLIFSNEKRIINNITFSR